MVRDRFLCAVAVGASFGTLGVADDVGAQILPVVTIESGPTAPDGVFTECNDAVSVVDLADSLIIRRDSIGAPLDVYFDVSGTAEAGVHYEPLSGVVTIPQDASEVVVKIDPLPTDRTRLVDLSVSLVDDVGYDVGDPAGAAIQFVSPRDPTLPPLDCNPWFEVSDAPTNREQTIGLGEVPVPLRTNAGSNFGVHILDGMLPPGVELDPGDAIPGYDGGVGGGFVGGATTPGNYDATLSMCPSGIVRTCRTQQFTVHVVGVDELPRTGSLPTRWLVAGVVLVAAGVVMTRHYRVVERQRR